ncbi:MAG: site-2 protease family protein, partial [Mycoplasmataceae bacterium]|nr:site-2 protease family protein [Mycoplasmataceae bacterium]
MNLIITILILGIIILIHELGHFLTAKYFKMPVSEFSIGMGPKLYSHETLETTYSIRAIPIGGFVNIDGMEVESEVENGFNSKSPIARFAVLFAGVFMNFILALVIIYGMVISGGKVIQSEDAVIGNVMEESKAYNILEKDDKILEINDRTIGEWSDILGIVKDEVKKEGDIITLVVLRGGEEIKLEIEPYFDVEREQPIIGILPDYTVEKYGLIDGFKV